MTRVTAPISKLTRALASHPSVARPAYLGNAAAHAHFAGTGASLRSELEREDNNRRFTTKHRPTPAPVPSPSRTVPLMQTFTTSAPAAARLDESTIDFFRLPALAVGRGEGAAVEPDLRVPLLPDNFFPDREAIDSHAPEAVDGPVAAPQIVVVSAHPDVVAPASALTEIESIGLDGVELKFAHSPEAGGGGGPAADGFLSGASINISGFGGGDDVSTASAASVVSVASVASKGSSSAAETATEKEAGLLKDLWRGLVEDIAGPTTASQKTH